MTLLSHTFFFPVPVKVAALSNHEKTSSHATAPLYHYMHRGVSRCRSINILTNIQKPTNVKRKKREPARRVARWWFQSGDSLIKQGNFSVDEKGDMFFLFLGNGK